MRRILALSIILIFMEATLIMAIIIPPEVKEIVSFIFVPGKDGELKPYGTGFFVGVKVSERSENYAVYFITAKHVLQRPDKKSFFSAAFLRLNKKDGKTEMLRLSISESGIPKNVFVHKDSTVDLAVIPVLPDQQKYDFKFLPDDYITTRDDYKKLKIRDGSEIFFTGLFTPHIGEYRNYPIVRFGRVALVTDEKIFWEGQKTELYLIESASYGGNSGSPVFFYLGSEREPGKFIFGRPVIKLAGIMKGSFAERRPIQTIETAKVEFSISNIGIAAVVPSYKLHEILFGKELKNQRKKIK
ncbi:MAG: trypsin-like peptidase domain-containing protein [Desulfobacteraceae bacterium]|nr:trypsin-like peptidase domain-containing protein [Desulfobacteraceae bacterium]